MIDMIGYWPFGHVTNTFRSGANGIYETVVQEYSLSPCPGLEGLFSMQHQLINGVWTSDWYMAANPAGDLYEAADNYPSGLRILNPSIPWGGQQEMGSEISAAIGIEGGPFGIGGQTGWQYVKFLEVFPTFETPGGTFENVLLLFYNQTWQSNPVGSGGNLFLAPGKGIIRAEWANGGVPSGIVMELTSTI